MAVSTIHRVFHTLPEELDNYLSAKPEVKQKFDISISNAQKQNVGSGSNHYSSSEEWAEFTMLSDAIRCDYQMAQVIGEFTLIAQKANGD